MSRHKSKLLNEFAEDHPARMACVRIAIKYSFTLNELLERCRDQRHAAARAECFVRLREAPFEWSYPRIAGVFGMDHTTVFHHVNGYAERHRTQKAQRYAASAEHVSP